MLCKLKILVSCLVLSLTVLVSPGALASTSDQVIGKTERVVGEVYGNSVLRRLKTDEALLRDQRVRAGVDGAADLRFLDKSRLKIGPRSEIILDKFVYDPDTNAVEGTLNLVRGVLRFTSAAVDRNITFKTRAVVIGIRGTVFDLMATDRSTEIMVHEGRVEVATSRNGTISLTAGQSLTVTANGISLTTRESALMRASVSEMLALAGDQPDQIQRAQSDSGAGRPAIAGGDDVAAAVLGKDPENLLYLDLPYGRVIIEMRSDLAPRHVARVKELVRAGFYDGLNFHVVQPGQFAMTGDPTGTGRGGSGTTLEAELSGEPFGRGSVGMAHDRGKPDSADSQFFVSLDTNQAIDGQYTLWGQVIHGMQFIDQLRAGTPPADPDAILQMRVGTDLAG